ADAEGGSEADEQALAVVEGQRGVDRLARLDAEERRQAEAGHREAEVADDGGLRIAGRARGVDVEEDVAAAEVGEVRLVGAGEYVAQGAHVGGEEAVAAAARKRPGCVP